MVYATTTLAYSNNYVFALRLIYVMYTIYYHPSIAFYFLLLLSCDMWQCDSDVTPKS